MALSDDKVYTNAAGGTLLDTPAANDRNFVFEKLYAKDLATKEQKIEDLEEKIHGIQDSIGAFRNALNLTLKKDISFDSSKTYNTGDYVYKESGNYSYFQAKEDGTTGEWDETKWEPNKNSEPSVDAAMWYAQ